MFSGRLLIKGGVLVTPDELAKADLLIVGQTIAQVAADIVDDEAELVDASGLYLLPGAIDAHVHLRDPGATHKEDFYSGTCAALAGGVTTVLDMPNNPQPIVDRESLDGKLEVARRRAVCDYGLYIGGTPDNPGRIEELEVVGLKLYLGATTGSLLVSDFPSIYKHFSSFPADRPLVVHGEHNEALDYFAHQRSAARHSQRRPVECAAISVAQSIALAETTGRRLHIAHLSTAAELQWVIAARARGVRVTCEVSPHHLFLTDEDELRLGPLAVMNPPLRSAEDVAQIWQNLAAVDMVATDHAPHTLEEKQSGRPPSGVPGLETMLPLLLTAVGQGRLSLEAVVRLTAQGPAQSFGLAGKGALQVGYDADVTLVRLEQRYRLGERPWQSRCGWSPFDGLQVQGLVTQVFVRGALSYAGGEILAAPGTGRPVRVDTT